MSVIDLFSKRQKRIRGEAKDVYQYNEIPNALRIQVVHILNEVLGTEEDYKNRALKVKAAYDGITKALHKEYGVFSLNTYGQKLCKPPSELQSFILHEKNIEFVLDAVELSFRFIDNACREYNYKFAHNADKKVTDALIELNERFKEHAVGYQYESGFIIRTDSQYIHTQAVIPALSILGHKKFSGAQQEFLSAHEHYRTNKYKEALNDALKSLESVIKVILDARGWKYEKHDPIKKLLDKCFEHELIPAFWQTSFSSLRSLLEGSVPTGRNKLSAHGQGSDPVEVPEHLASYILHMTASTILFLVKADENL